MAELEMSVPAERVQALGSFHPDQVELGLAGSQATLQEVVGAPTEPFTVRVLALSGECLIEKTTSAAQALRVQDLVPEVVSAMKVSAHKVKILCGTDLLPRSQELARICRQDDHSLELQAIMVDSSNGDALPMRPGKVRELKASDDGSRLEVTFAPGEITELHGLTLMYHHTVTVRVHTQQHYFHTEASLLSATAMATSETDLRTMTLDVHIKDALRPILELLLTYCEVSIRTEATVPPKNSACNTSTVAFCESPFEFGPVNQAQSRSLFFRLATCWTLDSLVLVITCWLAVVELLAYHYWQGATLVATLWLPGFIWASRYSCYCMSRKYTGIASLLACPQVCIPSWCCGIVWAWLPLVLLCASPPWSAWQLGRLFLRQRAAMHVPLLELEDIFLHELYMRDVRFLGDLPRLIAVPSIYALGIYSLPLGLTSLVVASLALLSVLLPPRRALMRAAYMYFDHVTMDPDSE